MKRRRATDTPPFSEMVTRSNLDDRLETIITMLRDHAAFDDERWVSHQAVHQQVADSLLEYKREANEWRSTLTDLRSTFLPKAEFQSEHRALEAKLHGEIAHLTGRFETLDTRVDANSGDLKDVRTEQAARRSVFSDTRSLIGTGAILIGALLTALLLLDQLNPP